MCDNKNGCSIVPMMLLLMMMMMISLLTIFSPRPTPRKLGKTSSFLSTSFSICLKLFFFFFSLKLFSALDRVNVKGVFVVHCLACQQIVSTLPPSLSHSWQQRHEQDDDDDDHLDDDHENEEEGAFYS